MDVNRLAPRVVSRILLAMGVGLVSGCAEQGVEAPASPVLSESLPSAAPRSAVPQASESREDTATSPGQVAGGEQYDPLVENDFVAVAQEPLSTFSVDVDTASYSNVRRFLEQGTSPPRDSVRIEELLNYFRYDDPTPTGDQPFAVHVEIAGCPWKPSNRIARIGLAGRPIATGQRPSSNLVFLLDVSGSMDAPDKLPLLKGSLQQLVRQLGENDRIAIVVYAGASGLVLPSTSCAKATEILEALENLRSGGATNGGAGIQLAYDQAVAHYIKGGTNRVILATDGDFNVGATDRGDLIRLIESKAKSGVFLTVLGFGKGNLKDATMEQLADKGNGQFAYIDSPKEARKVLVEELGATLVTIAKDVKIQVEFNPSKVGAYRLIGYENRALQARDFNDDTKDAGEIGAGHHVTALYELVPAGQEGDYPKVDDLEFQKPREGEAPDRPESLIVKLRYKAPEGETSQLIKGGVIDEGTTFSASTTDLRFASAVAGFGMLLRGSGHKGDWTFDDVLGVAREALGEDTGGYRGEFLGLVERAKRLPR